MEQLRQFSNQHEEYKFLDTSLISLTKLMMDVTFADNITTQGVGDDACMTFTHVIKLCKSNRIFHVNI